MYATNGNIKPIISKHAKRIQCVYCRDVNLDKWKNKREVISFSELNDSDIFTVPSEGDLNFESVFSGLATAKYSGWVVIGEPAKSKVDPTKLVVWGREHIEPILDENQFIVLDERQ